MSRISVIIPIYNCEKYINACIDSVLGQTVTDLEVILVDDGSTDATADICRSYVGRDTRIVYLRQENRGVSAARNQGLKAAKSVYVMFVDADDTISDCLCEKLLNRMEASPAAQSGEMAAGRMCTRPAADREIGIIGTTGYVDLVFCGFLRQFYQDDELKRLDLVRPECSDIENNQTLGAVFGRLYETTLLTSVWGKLYRKNKNDQMPFWFHADLELGEDLLFNLEYLKRCQRIAVVDETLYIYNQYGRRNSLTRKPSGERIQISGRLLGAAEDFAKGKGIYNQVKERLWKVYLKDCMNYLEQFSFKERLGKAEGVLRSDHLSRVLSAEALWKRDTLVYRVCLGSGSRILVCVFAEMRRMAKRVLRGN